MVLFLKNSYKRFSKILQRKKRITRAEKEARRSHFLETSQLIEGSLLLIFAALVIVISFLGQKSKGPQLMINQPASARIVAEFDFQYTSKILLEKQEAAIRAQEPPVFERSYENFNQFKQLISELQDSFAQNQIDYEGESEAVLKQEYEKSIIA